MEILRSILSEAVGGTLSWFAGRNPMLSLFPLSVLAGAAAFWIFAHTSDRNGIQKIKRRMAAHLYEMRLFADEPRLMWRAQRELLFSAASYVMKMLIPALISLLPMLLIFPQLESFYAYQPLQTGEDAIITLQMKDRAAVSAAPLLRAPPGIAIETPPVRLNDGQISWRIRALRPLRGELEFAFPNQTIAKSVQAGIGPRYLSERRVSSLPDLLWYPAEPRLPNGPVDWIEVRYPGLNFHWTVWLVVFSLASGVVLERSSLILRARNAAV